MFLNLQYLKQALNHRLISTKVDRVIRFNQEAWFKLYIEQRKSYEKMQKMILKKILQIGQ